MDHIQIAGGGEWPEGAERLRFGQHEAVAWGGEGDRRAVLRKRERFDRWRRTLSARAYGQGQLSRARLARDAGPHARQEDVEPVGLGDVGAQGRSGEEGDGVAVGAETGSHAGDAREARLLLAERAEARTACLRVLGDFCARWTSRIVGIGKPRDTAGRSPRFLPALPEVVGLTWVKRLAWQKTRLGRGVRRDPCDGGAVCADTRGSSDASRGISARVSEAHGVTTQKCGRVSVKIAHKELPWGRIDGGMIRQVRSELGRAENDVTSIGAD